MGVNVVGVVYEATVITIYHIGIEIRDSLFPTSTPGLTLGYLERADYNLFLHERDIHGTLHAYMHYTRLHFFPHSVEVITTSAFCEGQGQALPLRCAQTIIFFNLSGLMSPE